MRKRTWDILARFVSEEYGIKIVINESCPGPRIQLDTMTIELPEHIKDQNALAALSTLIHEAAHMKYSTIIPNDFSKTNIDHFIVNSMEDVRIDKKNFNLLPNIHDWYEVFMREHICTEENKKNALKQHMLTRCMVNLIITEEWFHNYAFDKEAQEYIQDKNVWQPFVEGVNAIENQDWVELRRCVDEIKSKFNIKNEERPLPPPPKEGEGQGQGKGQGKKQGNCAGEGVGAGKGEGESAGAGGQGNANGDGNSIKMGEIGDPTEIVRPNTPWEKGEGLRGPGGLEFNPIELTSMTRRKFIDTLNIKERRTRSDGQKLDTDNLIAFFTGDIDDLFIDDEEEKVKRSKIVFCLDASGSMSTRLFDKASRKKTLGKCVKSLIDILDEVKETEGLNVDYDVIGFACQPILYDKETWESQYSGHSGGTDLFGAVEKGVEVLSDSEIDGNKIIIVVTDGEVSDREVEEVRDLIMKNNSDIKAMLIGIGARDSYCKKLCGDNNIICLEHADQIVMESIQEMLETY